MLTGVKATQAGAEMAAAFHQRLLAVDSAPTELHVRAGGVRRDDRRRLAAGRDIDYDGVSGPIDFTDKGDPARAPIGVFQYRADHTAALVSHEVGELPA
ncbi:hypothetical protein [Nonomuraea lactucae]|uniref:hypothetical protein n=1 Tax=Nonomuraea lactucae TaxID=2249762 RepID=UPI000DE234B7|nr:hypothetical protein [Nonomuraea lactucae]